MQLYLVIGGLSNRPCSTRQEGVCGVQDAESRTPGERHVDPDCDENGMNPATTRTSRVAKRTSV